MRGSRAVGPATVPAVANPPAVVLAVPGPPPFQRWRIVALNVQHSPVSPVMPVAVYLGAIGPGLLVAQAPQGAINRASTGELTIGPGDLLYVVWTPQGSTNGGQVCTASIEYEVVT